MRKERAERLKHEVSNLNSRIENFDYTFYGEDKEGEYDKLILEFERTKKEYDALNKDIARAEAREEALRQFRAELADCGNVIDKFDDKLWCNLVDFLTVYSDTDIRVTFKDGTEIKSFI